jgi:predicted ATPase/DNA-binding SARP family transcriptional activator
MPSTNGIGKTAMAMALSKSATETGPLSMTLFGPMQVTVGDSPLPRLHSRKSLWLLALLTLRHGHPVERAWMAETLWPDADPDQAMGGLRSVMSDLRKALGSEGERLQSPNRHALRMDLAGADVDVISFDAAIKSRDLSVLERAVALYQGPLLEGCSEEWVGQERAEREQNCVQALQTLAEAALAAHDHSVAARYFRQAIRLDPWRDALQRGLMEALSLSGDRNGALQVYRDFTDLLRSIPRAVPDAQTSALYAQMRTEARRSGSAPTATTKGPTEEVPLPVVAGYLPHALSRLVGREDECLEVAVLLRQSRLVTLTGPGGIGKTRLAIAVATEVAGEYPDGVWLVPLEALIEDRTVAPQIVAVLEIKEKLGQAPLEAVASHLRDKRLLLVMDNCEHLMEASAHIARHILLECAGVRVLATSREPLAIKEETVWAVPGLSVPDPAYLPTGGPTLVRVLSGYEGVQMFVERAQAVQKTFALTADTAPAVAQVCSRLGGIPLALELAAARVRAMTLVQMVARLDDHLSLLTDGSRAAPSRQRTLRATLDWSYALLSVPEQLLLSRVSVFARGWSLEAAEAVCAGDGIEPGHVRDLLTGLVNKSLVTFDSQPLQGIADASGRYRLLEMVRQYAAERLEVDGPAARLRVRHRGWFLALAEAAEPLLRGPAQTVWLSRLEVEYDNLRTVLDECETGTQGIERERGEREVAAEAGLRLAGALWWFWRRRGRYSEGRGYLEQALARAQERTLARAKALNV